MTWLKKNLPEPEPEVNEVNKPLHCPKPARAMGGDCFAGSGGLKRFKKGDYV
jgi:hypothetical protein